MISRQDHAIRADDGPVHDPAASGSADQPSSTAAKLGRPPDSIHDGSRARQHDAGLVDVTTDSARRTGIDISELRGSVRLNPVDSSLLSEEVVGHAGLARVLQDFVQHWHHELGAYAAHLDDAGQQLELTASDYRATDDDAADTLSALDPDSRPLAEHVRDQT